VALPPLGNKNSGLSWLTLPYAAVEKFKKRHRYELGQTLAARISLAGPPKLNEGGHGAPPIVPNLIEGETARAMSPFVTPPRPKGRGF